ncbi:hypothetical protein FGO68_gene17740 [Halteria grandinella]|uniref:Uncharacterized protein n=1 Tax=Halteria grandinella TaxID=5974 RepID=A0A8J8SZ96_HALGN|nr:hypothetical protein FGO68_gene17740 [Halteria grandinella]
MGHPDPFSFGGDLQDSSETSSAGYHHQQPGHTDQQDISSQDSNSDDSISDMQQSVGEPMFSSQGSLTSAAPSQMSINSAAFLPTWRRATAWQREVQEERQSRVAEDPCFGKPSNFFEYDVDPDTDQIILQAEQLTFIAIHYSDQYSNPQSIIDWLHFKALQKENQLRQIRNVKLMKRKPT